MFLLSKWYCDCVNDEGAAFVGYSARMQWGLLSIPYAATLYRRVSGAMRKRYSIRACPAPTMQDEELRWECRRLGARGVWMGCAPALTRTLLEIDEGSITWRCHAPNARARVELDGAGELIGLGYAEHLTLSLRPWRLPFAELRWGRFLSAEDTLIWIEWPGREPRRWVFHNGTELQGATIGSERVELPNGRGGVELHDAVVLREGRLASTALRVLPAARLWLPKGIKNAHETKWLARGTFTAGTRSSSGWAIHEVLVLR